MGGGGGGSWSWGGVLSGNSNWDWVWVRVCWYGLDTSSLVPPERARLWRDDLEIGEARDSSLRISLVSTNVSFAGAEEVEELDGVDGSRTDEVLLWMDSSSFRFDLSLMLGMASMTAGGFEEVYVAEEVVEEVVLADEVGEEVSDVFFFSEFEMKLSNMTKISSLDFTPRN